VPFLEFRSVCGQPFNVANPSITFSATSTAAAPPTDRMSEMVVHGFEKSLASLEGTTVRTSIPESFPEPGIAPVELHFSDGSRLRLDYWRIIRDDKAHTSSFDHQQKHGLPAPIDAFAQIAEALDGRTVREAKWDARTGDLALSFEPNVELQVFNFTGYEDWEIHFPNDTGEYSNTAR
jgi:hypothetical protein